MSVIFEKVVAVTALVVGPLSLIVTTVWQWMLQPSGVHPTAADVAAQFPAAWLTIGLLAVCGPLVWLMGLPATATPTGRGSLTTRIGALVTGIGLAAGIGHLAAFFAQYGAIVAAHLGDDATAAMNAAAEAEPIGNILLLVFLIGYSLGPIILTVGLRMARTVGVWVPLAAVITAGANLFGGPIAGVVQLVALIAVWGSLVIVVLREHTPSVERATRRDTPTTLVHRKSDVGTRP
ncbi:hypothetical protein ET475_00575 [Microbacterium protaetiae]|uniref:DUF4386 family protein n=1 Tax=Microbacterium protaetiae TaxID=2509458 RepID=A0A4P6E9C2_9MICO|nr:hypothetical protein [Microbacterium protaetiae]QAY58645.1 hypothetical protein ET475_00575 [Microbacterium protaetiae]